MAYIIDTHAHIYDIKYKEDQAQVVAAAQAAGVQKILMPNCAEETIAPMLQCEKDYPDVCIPMMGLHPCYVIDSNLHHELHLVEQWLQQRSFCAVGEIGLDYHWDTTFVAEQKMAYVKQIELALHHNLPIVVHSRESMRDCIELAKPYIAKGLRGVFHCFSGSLQEAQELVKMGFYLGIGGVVTYAKTRLVDVVKEIPLEHLILETDAPYLTPVPHRGKRNEPSYITYVAQTLADSKAISYDELCSATSENAKKLFGFA